MIITVETITPKVAEAWINANKSNRRLRDGIVEKYADDMKHDRWTTCPEPISFYDDGDLADGQHRLFAIIESGTEQTFPVARGLKRSDGLNINTGFGRTLVDNARISKNDEGLSTALISAARAIEFGTINIGRSLSNGETLAIVEKHREAAQFAATEVRRKSLLCGAAVLGAVGRAYEAGVDHDRLRRFCDVLATGLYTGEGETPAIAIRNYLLEKGSVLSSSGLWTDTFVKVQNAIRYFAEGRKLSVIKSVAEEPYPLRKTPPKQKKRA